ncbi:MAG: hypothetical protein ACU0BF_12130 [Paracoccaceae bacterium]
MPRLAVLTLICACLVAAWAGWRLARVPSETEVIDALVGRYLAERPGGRATDCHAVPGVPPVRLSVVCDDGAWVAHAGRRGRAVVPPPDAPI